MIKANELRIGNYVLGAFDIPINVSPTQILNLYHNLESIKPIPLTVEWLKEKFDCKIINDGIWDRIDCNYKDLEKSIFPLFTLYYSKPTNEFMYVVAHERINKSFVSVHKLQNIHFEVKGEELKIA